MSDRVLSRPGYQGSETSWISAKIYRHGDDPVVLTPPDRLDPVGKRASDREPSLIAASTSKAMGEAAGTFQLQLKPSKAVEDLFDQIVDDDWIDLVVHRHDRGWHVIRGLIDDIRRREAVGGNGVTTTAYTITGRDFGKTWDSTPVWFSPFANDFVTKAISNQVLEGRPELLGSPAEAVENFLRKFFEEVATETGVNWNPPAGMPGIEGNSFLKSVAFDTADHYSDIPERKAFNPNEFNPSGSLWSLAEQYSDPGFCEFYVDLLPDGDSMSPRIAAGDPLGPEDTQMTVVLRDKPFPVVSRLETEFGWPKHWSGLPVIDVPRQQISNMETGKGGMERFNAFYVSMLLHQESMAGNDLDILAPLIDSESLKRHGIRRMDIRTSFVPVEIINYNEFAEIARNLMLNWYALNPYLLNGSIALRIARPDLKIGTRIRVPASMAQYSEDEYYYVEQVGHDWTFGKSVKTNLGVTRGWRGDDSSLGEALGYAVERYRKPAKILDKDFKG